jgi:hypothetical protein
MTEVQTYPHLIGQTIVEHKIVTDDFRTPIALVLKDEENFLHMFYHEQDCCEEVRIVDIEGDLDDLMGSPILLAELVSQEGDDEDASYITDDSYTWSFLKIRTAAGGVTIRWLGESNGYYGEEVDYIRRLSNG